MKWLEKGALALMTGIMPVFIAACYGGPMDDDYYTEHLKAWGTVKDKLSGNPIANILVKCMSGTTMLDETYSASADGSFELTYWSDEPCETLVFEDIDGEENGGQYKTASLPISDETTVELELEE